MPDIDRKTAESLLRQLPDHFKAAEIKRKTEMRRFAKRFAGIEIEVHVNKTIISMYEELEKRLRANVRQARST